MAEKKEKAVEAQVETAATEAPAVENTVTETPKAKAKTEAPKAEVKTEAPEVSEAPATEVEAKVETPVVPEAKVDPEKFLKEFNWHNYEEGIDPVDDKQLEEFEKLVSENFVDTLDDEVVEGTVIHMTDRDAIIDINAKSEGVISLNEFRYNSDLKVGDKVEVLIDVREDATGQLVL
ncbi:MAG: hypothetical protein DA407_12575, partial [Bacteroidetes bacterium]